MNRILQLFITGAIICSCAATQTNENFRYFDENYNEISQAKFKRIRATNQFLDIPGDSANHKLLTEREFHGKISSRVKLDNQFEAITGKKIIHSQPLVVIYYPGNDPCNSSSFRSREWKLNWYQQLEEGLEKITDFNLLYVYKDFDGLEQLSQEMMWIKDPEGIIEKLFFEHHFPCKSFVVIAPTGRYIAYYGEFPKEFVWRATDILTE